jgi:succinoglycan biosynthesis protein ExoV
MQIYFADMRNDLSGRGNFGDELNLWLWPKELGSLIDSCSSVTLVGIGTVLSNKLERFSEIAVCGAGAGYGSVDRSRLKGWAYSVRGRLTADRLRLPEAVGIVDPGVLVSRHTQRPAQTRTEVAYMPHAFEVARAGSMLKTICTDNGIRLIDPCDDVPTVIDQINTCRLLVTEAMHGAIVADSLRIPWCPVVTSGGILQFKWQDFCDSVGLQYRARRIAKFARLRSLGKWYEIVERKLFEYQLRRIVRAEVSVLSEDSVIEQQTSRLLEKLECLKGDLARNQIGRSACRL